MNDWHRFLWIQGVSADVGNHLAGDLIIHNKRCRICQRNEYDFGQESHVVEVQRLSQWLVLQ